MPFLPPNQQRQSTEGNTRQLTLRNVVKKKVKSEQVYRRPELVVAKDDDEKGDEVAEEHWSIDVH